MAVGRGINGSIPSGLKVMVVDEDPTCLLFITFMLKACLFTVESFSDAVKALCAVCMKRGQFDLVMVDYHMLRMPAFELVESIVTGFGIPVITTSADSDPEIQLEAFKRGSCLHLVKPITLDDMGVVWQKAWGIEANI
ncbi:two-component response regulator ORR25-like [Asparagus officinalis]|uniref:two-component response regulator ORR25-like n=1 Tax=Asparagus officinalis TaxID=4686 RepID=UPI00098E7506|nr:two-component response regulator ORR25-like [Asparagus officinalis]XP_020268484.1 two-component response regulator ORR25-like [Asparagus officinalis]